MAKAFKPDRAERRRQRLQALTTEERRQSLDRLCGYLWVWHRALDQQDGRLRQQGVMTGGPDTWLYAVALGTTLRCVRLAGDLGVDTTDALAAFDAAVPDAKKVRDVLEHLEDYELGIGDLQRSPRDRLEFLYSSDSGGMASIELQGVGVRLHLQQAHAAAQMLLAQVLEAVVDAAGASAP